MLVEKRFKEISRTKWFFTEEKDCALYLIFGIFLFYISFLKLFWFYILFLELF